MGLEFRKDRNGKIVRTWYCLFRHNGKKIARALDTPFKGKPPSSGLISDMGDKDFEASRQAAIQAFEELKAQYKRIDETDEQALAQKAFDIKKGIKRKDVKVGDLEKVYASELGNGLKRSRKRTKTYLDWKKNSVARFVAWWKNTGRSPKALTWEIAPDDAKAYIDFLSQADENGKMLKTDTISRIKTILADAISTTLPTRIINPFKGISVGRQKGEQVVHREPLSKEDADLLVKTAAKYDPLVHELIVTGLSTALRRGDVCRLKWESVNLSARNGNSPIIGTIKVELGKTGRMVEIPIFPQFRIILEKRLAEREDGAVYVFPEAVALIEHHPDSLTYRIKKVFARTFAPKHNIEIQEAITENATPLKDNLEKVINAVEMARMPQERRVRTIEFLKLYAQGKSFNVIAAETKSNKSTISTFLSKAEKLSGIVFTPSKKSKQTGMRDAIAEITRCERTIGKRRGSIYDFHALRTTFVTLAAIYNIPLETIALITGHTNTRMIQEHYDRARGSDFAERFAAALPSSVTAEPVTRLANGANGGVITTGGDNGISSKNFKLLKDGLSKSLTEKQKKELLRALLS